MTNSSEIFENFEADKWHICGQTVCLFCKKSFKKFSQNAASVWNSKFRQNYTLGEQRRASIDIFYQLLIKISFLDKMNIEKNINKNWRKSQ